MNRPHGKKRRTATSFVSAFCILISALSCAAQAASFSLPSRPTGHRLPESLWREALATSERGRQWLRQGQRDDGYWELPDGHKTCFPALAFAMADDSDYGDVVAKAKVYAIAWIERDSGKVLNERETEELAYTGLLLRAVGEREDLQRRVEERLAKSPRRGESLRLGLLLDVCSESQEHTRRVAWGQSYVGDVLIRASRQTWNSDDARTPGNVAQAGIERMMRDDDTSGAALAHLKWITASGVFGDGASRRTLPRQTLPPSEAWWVTRFVDMVPLAWRHEAGIPQDWRVKVADAIIASQKRDGAWGNNEERLWETTCAVWVLELITN